MRISIGRITWEYNANDPAYEAKINSILQGLTTIVKENLSESNLVEVHFVDRIIIDLGDFEVGEDLQKPLSESLVTALQNLDLSNYAKPYETYSTVQSAQRWLLYYLRTGRTPWWAGTDYDVSVALTTLIQEEHASSFLLQVSKLLSSASAFQRVLHQFSPVHLRQLIHLLTSGADRQIMQSEMDVSSAEKAHLQAVLAAVIASSAQRSKISVGSEGKGGRGDLNWLTTATVFLLRFVSGSDIAPRLRDELILVLKTSAKLPDHELFALVLERLISDAPEFLGELNRMGVLQQVKSSLASQSSLYRQLERYTKLYDSSTAYEELHRGSFATVIQGVNALVKSGEVSSYFKEKLKKLGFKEEATVEDWLKAIMLRYLDEQLLFFEFLFLGLEDSNALKHWIDVLKRSEVSRIKRFASRLQINVPQADNVPALSTAEVMSQDHTSWLEQGQHEWVNDLLKREAISPSDLTSIETLVERISSDESLFVELIERSTIFIEGNTMNWWLERLQAFAGMVPIPAQAVWWRRLRYTLTDFMLTGAVHVEYKGVLRDAVLTLSDDNNLSQKLFQAYRQHEPVMALFSVIGMEFIEQLDGEDSLDGVDLLEDTFVQHIKRQFVELAEPEQESSATSSHGSSRFTRELHFYLLWYIFENQSLPSWFNSVEESFLQAFPGVSRAGVMDILIQALMRSEPQTLAYLVVQFANSLDKRRSLARVLTSSVLLKLLKTIQDDQGLHAERIQRFSEKIEARSELSVASISPVEDELMNWISLGVMIESASGHLNRVAELVSIGLGALAFNELNPEEPDFAPILNKDLVRNPFAGSISVQDDLLYFMSVLVSNAVVTPCPLFSLPKWFMDEWLLSYAERKYIQRQAPPSSAWDRLVLSLLNKYDFEHEQNRAIHDSITSKFDKFTFALEDEAIDEFEHIRLELASASEDPENIYVFSGRSIAHVLLTLVYWLENGTFPWWSRIHSKEQLSFFLRSVAKQVSGDELLQEQVYLFLQQHDGFFRRVQQAYSDVLFGASDYGQSQLASLEVFKWVEEYFTDATDRRSLTYHPNERAVLLEVASFYKTALSGDLASVKKFTGWFETRKELWSTSPYGGVLMRLLEDVWNRINSLKENHDEGFFEEEDIDGALSEHWKAKNQGKPEPWLVAVSALVDEEEELQDGPVQWSQSHLNLIRLEHVIRPLELDQPVLQEMSFISKILLLLGLNINLADFMYSELVYSDLLKVSILRGELMQKLAESRSEYADLSAVFNEELLLVEQRLFRSHAEEQSGQLSSRKLTNTGRLNWPTVIDAKLRSQLVSYHPNERVVISEILAFYGQISADVAIFPKDILSWIAPREFYLKTSPFGETLLHFFKLVASRLEEELDAEDGIQKGRQDFERAFFSSLGDDYIAANLADQGVDLARLRIVRNVVSDRDEFNRTFFLAEVLSFTGIQLSLANYIYTLVDLNELEVMETLRDELQSKREERVGEHCLVWGLLEEEIEALYKSRTGTGEQGKELPEYDSEDRLRSYKHSERFVITELLALKGELSRTEGRVNSDIEEWISLRESNVLEHPFGEVLTGFFRTIQTSLQEWSKTRQEGGVGIENILDKFREDQYGAPSISWSNLNLERAVRVLGHLNNDQERLAEVVFVAKALSILGFDIDLYEFSYMSCPAMQESGFIAALKELEEASEDLLGRNRFFLYQLKEELELYHKRFEEDTSNKGQMVLSQVPDVPKTQGSPSYLRSFQELLRNQDKFKDQSEGELWSNVLLQSEVIDMLLNSPVDAGLEDRLQDTRQIPEWVDEKNDWTEINLEDRIYIPNAGVILLWPFFSRLFKKLGLVESGVFVDFEAQTYAVYVLEYLVEGSTLTPEPFLILNKLLTGIPLEDSIPLMPALPQEMADECDLFLTSVMSGWKQMSGTSIGAFQSSFLRRSGVLEKGDSGWFLYVDHQVIDILLKTLPWGLSIAKFAWMKNPIFIEWKATN